MIFQLNKNDISFPDPNLAEDDGLLAIYGDLSVDRLICAYKNGIFPWPHKNFPLLWFSPPFRAILYPKDLKISRSFKKSIKKFEIKFDTNFEQVIRNCAISRKDNLGTWIDDRMIKAYTKLYEIGIAHSVESYFENKLVGGLYGINIGNIFCGESMFSTKSDASKVALFALCQKVAKTNGLIDAQILNSHLKSLGVKEISRKEYLKILHVEKEKDSIFK